MDFFKEEYLPHLRAFSDVRELIERIQKDGKRVALASSAKGDEVDNYKKIANIEDLIKYQTSTDDAEKSKPHPDIFHAAIAKLGDIDPTSAIVVGDTPWDAIAAAKAGMKTVGMLCGGFSAESLKEAGCIAIYANPADLLARYDESPLAGKS